MSRKDFEVSEHLRKLQKKLGLTQVELAAKMGVHPSSIGNYLYQNRMPAPLSCLFLAGLCDSLEDRLFFRSCAGLDDQQLGLLKKALE